MTNKKIGPYRIYVEYQEPTPDGAETVTRLMATCDELRDAETIVGALNMLQARRRSDILQEGGRKLDLLEWMNDRYYFEQSED